MPRKIRIEILIPRYVEAIHRKDYVEYLMDTILTGSPEEKAALCAERNPDIRRMSIDLHSWQMKAIH